MILKLSIVLIPHSARVFKLKKLVSEGTWHRLSKQVCASRRCAICGISEISVMCEEDWVFDDTTATQTLMGFLALCPMCYHIKHIELAMLLACTSSFDYEAMITHYWLINDCTRDDFFRDRREAIALRVKRSKQRWKIDLGPYANLISSEM